MKECEENDMTGYLTKLKHEVANGDAVEGRSAYAKATADRQD